MKQLTSAGVMLALALAATAALGQEDAGMVKVSKGDVLIERAGQRVPASVGSKVSVQDRVLTGPTGSVGISLRDNTMLSAGPNSILELNKFSFDSTTHAGAVDASIRRGTLSVISGKIAKASPDAVVFSAPGMTLGVRGTEFLVDAGAPLEQ